MYHCKLSNFFFSSSSIQLSSLLSCNEVLHCSWSSWSMKDQRCCRRRVSYILCLLRERPWRHSVPKHRHRRAHCPDRLRKHLAVLRHKLLTRRNSLVRPSVAIGNRSRRELTLEYVALAHCQDGLWKKDNWKFCFDYSVVSTWKFHFIFTFKNFLAPSGGDAVVVWRDCRSCNIIQTDWTDMRIVFNVIFEVKECNIMFECVAFELWMEDDFLHTNNLEWFWLLVAAQAPFAGLDEHVVVSVAE